MVVETLLHCSSSFCFPGCAHDRAPHSLSLVLAPAVASSSAASGTVVPLLAPERIIQSLKCQEFVSFGAKAGLQGGS